MEIDSSNPEQPVNGQDCGCEKARAWIKLKQADKIMSQKMLKFFEILKKHPQELQAIIRKDGDRLKELFAIR